MVNSMSFSTISVYLLIPLIAIVPTDARACANSPDETTQAERTENPRMFGAFEKDLDEIIREKTFKEIIQEIINRADDLDRVKIVYFAKPGSTLETFIDVTLESISFYCSFDTSSLYLQLWTNNFLRKGKEIDGGNSNKSTDGIRLTTHAFVKAGMEKLKRINVELRSYSTNFNEKAVKFEKMCVQLQNQSSNGIYEQLQSRFEKTRIYFENIQTKLEDEVEVNIDVIEKINQTLTYLEEKTENIQLLTQSAAVYDDYLQSHGIILSTEFEKRLENNSKIIIPELSQVKAIFEEAVENARRTGPNLLDHSYLFNVIS